MCESVCNGSWELVVSIPAVRGRAGGITEMYDEKIVHQGCLWGRVRSALGRVSYSMLQDISKKKCEYLFTPAVTSCGGGLSGKSFLSNSFPMPLHKKLGPGE